MGCTIVFVILLVIGMGILCFLTGDMAAFIALSATLVVGLGLAGILYPVYAGRFEAETVALAHPVLFFANVEYYVSMQDESEFFAFVGVFLIGRAAGLKGYHNRLKAVLLGVRYQPTYYVACLGLFFFKHVL